MTHNRYMADLYGRLKIHGFDSKFIQNHVLPDWWEDNLAANPANRAIAEAAISRQLGFKIAQLREKTAALQPPAMANFRFKRRDNSRPAEIKPALIVAQRTASLIAEYVRPALPPFVKRMAAREIRAQILSRSLQVNLENLLKFAWEHGIAVVHLSPDCLPRSTHKFQGISMFAEQIPFVILASDSDSPPWLAFHVSHEIGHIMLGHVTALDSPLVDLRIDHADAEKHEAEADKFATLVLAGEEQLSFQSEDGLTATKLVEAAQRYGQSHGIDPGTVALVYGRSADRWPVAQKALKALHQDLGAHQLITAALALRLPVAEMSESAVRFLSFLSPVQK